MKKIVYFYADNYTRVRRRATLFSSRAIFGRFTWDFVRNRKKRNVSASCETRNERWVTKRIINTIFLAMKILHTRQITYKLT